MLRGIVTSPTETLIHLDRSATRGPAMDRLSVSLEIIFGSKSFGAAAEHFAFICLSMPCLVFPDFLSP